MQPSHRKPRNASSLANATTTVNRGEAGLLLALACAGSFVVILDATIVSVALPAIRAELGFTDTTLPWVVNAYTLAFAGCLLLGGRLSDVYGQRRMFVLGMGLFTLARTVGGLVSSAEPLLAARAVQGVGGALLMPVTLSLLTTTFTEPAQRARMLGTWSAVGAVGAAAGPVLGGLLTEWAGWRWVFFVSVPIGVLAVAAARATLPPRPDGAVRPRLDVLGAVLVTAGLVGIVYAVMHSADAGASVWPPLLAGAAVLGVFLVHQARWSREPLVPLGIFRLRSVSSGNVVMLLLGLGFFASPILLSLYLQDVHGYSPLHAGLGYLPIGAAQFAGAQLAGALSVRLGVRRAAVLSCLVGAAGLAGVALLIGVHASYVTSVMLPGLVFGFGTTAAFTPITMGATSGVPEHQNGLAAGLLNTVRQTSGAIGLAVLSVLSAAVAASWRAAHSGDDLNALAHGYTAAFAASAVCLAVAGIIAAVAMPGDQQGAGSSVSARNPGQRSASPGERQPSRRSR
ncbi:drug resistance transporter, EmrB/QacA subfamily [Saccharopolyspora kobensis]|uniref:Drug resistance transporter, EmrB/QacA subfamily n=1 Tax=Saccharopolyspora kobensis TaxID=146035 RepID=A0A1H6CXG8_9PSEU|nr:drug resistance transporter, EmrB/QacA subfamily [Saccharopolyspora kobensis]SFD03679.1 drug resistance transporter, EmrB/QacA subfamily [Saccharopolyspora kobensis]